MNKKDAKNKIRIRGQKEMKRKTGISLMMALLMILSTLAIVTPVGATDNQDVKLEVTKEVSNVSNNGDWKEYIEAVYGDTVQFNITIKYNGVYCAGNIIVKDTLPSGLKYIQTVEPNNIAPELNGNVIIWDLGDKVLLNGCSTTILFNATVVGLGENINTANVTADECCTSEKLYGESTATVFVNPSVDVEKKVWDPEKQKWADELYWIIKGEKVRFQIAITYHGTDLMKCMNVEDYLGYYEYGCLDYADNVKFTYPSTQFGDPEITVSENLKYVEFNWTKSLFNLYDGESIVIEFDANATKYCEECFVENEAYVDLWSCESCTHLSGYDYATVYCTAHPPIFNKKVYNGEVYADDANVYVNDTVRFKIELTYYGIDNLTDVKIVDDLPCILKYAGNEKVKIVHSAVQAIEILEIDSTVSVDKKTIWWNLTNELSDRDTLSIEFDALVTGITGDCGDCGINTASYTGYSNGNDYSGSDTAQISSTHRPPPPPAKLVISFKRFSIGHIQATITNSGTDDVLNVKWNMSVKCGLFGKDNSKI